jgi:ABC-type multidrug transport system ATPase subunit
LIQKQTICLKGFDLSKSFYGGSSLFTDLSFVANGGEALGISGENGSGKSTLLCIMAGLLGSNAGKVEFKIENNIIKKSKFQVYYGFSAPYLGLYEEFNIEEHAQIYADLKDFSFDKNYFDSLLEDSSLSSSRKKLLRHYSSGMKQRAKLIFSVLSRPKILFLDEPSSNLDDGGKLFAERLIEKQISDLGIVVIASNERDELKLCNKTIKI